MNLSPLDHSARSIRTPVWIIGGLCAVSILAASQAPNPAHQVTLALLFLAFVALAIIDIESRLLPDAITLPMIALGLLVNATEPFVPLSSAIAGSIAAYGLMWLLSASYRKATGREGLGAGDVKLAAMIAAWVGLGHGLLAIGFAFAFAACAAIAFRRRVGGTSAYLPFGPFLATAGGLAAWALVTP